MHRLNMEQFSGSGDSNLKIRSEKLIPNACDITLDPNTAFIGVSLSEGNRKVKRVKENLPYPDHPERFECFGQVLSVESFTGRCYWEVEWSGWMAEISVSYRRIQRKGGSYESRFGRNKNSWSLECSGNGFTLYHNNQETQISASPCNRVGVYMDWKEGTLSFYSIKLNTPTLTHLHTINTTFTEPLYAGFTVWEGSSACMCVW